MPSICFSHKDISTTDRGGVCVLFKTLIKGLLDRNWDVSCITTQNFSMEGVTVFTLPHTKDPWNYSKKVTQIIRQIKPDIAECSTWRFELLDYCKQMQRKTKVVVRCDPSSGTLFPSASNLDTGEMELCKQADLLIAVSKFAKKDIDSKYKVNSHLVYNGVSSVNLNILNLKHINSGEILNLDNNLVRSISKLKLTEIIDKNKINIVWIGKPTLMKGFDYLGKIIKESSDQINFIINIGYSPIQVNWKPDNYARAIFIRGLNKIDQQTLMSKTDGLLSTSRAEGFGLIVPETLGLGLPVLLNDRCKVFNEFASNPGVFLVDVKNTKKTIEAITNLKGKKVDYSRNLYKFTDKSMIESSCRYYHELL